MSNQIINNSLPKNNGDQTINNSLPKNMSEQDSILIQEDAWCDGIRGILISQEYRYGVKFISNSQVALKINASWIENNTLFTSYQNVSLIKK